MSHPRATAHLDDARLRANATVRTDKILRLLATCKPLSDEQRTRLHDAVDAVPSQDGPVSSTRVGDDGIPATVYFERGSEVAS